MTNYAPIFNAQQYELRGYSGSYFSEDQLSAVESAQDRVNQQFDWLAQILGWNGPDYWTNLTSLVSQKRRLLGGTFGVYNSYILPKVVCIRNWDSTADTSPSEPLLRREIFQNQNKLWIVIERDERIQEGQDLLIGDYSSTVNQIRAEGDNYVLQVEGEVDVALSNFQSGDQLLIGVRGERPFPFNRPEIKASGDGTFSCLVKDGALELHPLWDSTYSLPYRFSALMVGATYWFDKPVYLSKDQVRIIDEVAVPYPQDVQSVYDFTREQWCITIPPTLAAGEIGTKCYIVWLYSNQSTETFSVKEVTLRQWEDPSDWNYAEVLQNYLGTWGNKGGFLPYNFVFDSLDIHGFDEQKSIYMAPIRNKVSFDELLNFVYYQKVSTDAVSTGKGENGEVWWDSSTGSFSVWESSPYGCGSWEEILYPLPANQSNMPERVYPDMDNFRYSSATLPVGMVIEIEDITGLTTSDSVIGVLGQLFSPAKLKLVKLEEGPYWTPLEFFYANEGDFDTDAQNLPFSVPVTMIDSVDLGTPRTNYVVDNLKFVITETLPVVLIKTVNRNTWGIKPTSNLKYIGNTRLFSSEPDPVNGAMNWNYDNPDEEARRAVIYYYSSYEQIDDEWVLTGAWVDINTGEAVDPPDTSLNFGTIMVYCEGNLVEEGDTYQTDNFTFYFTVDATTGEFVFNYDAITFLGSVQLPQIEISDSLTGVFRYDISEYVFSGIQYYMSPNVLDCETPLRIWKPQELQVEGEEVYLKDSNYANVLRADQNNGPAAENWEKYFVRLSPRFQRNDPVWQKVALVCQNFGYWGLPVQPRDMQCPSEDDAPRIYEQAVLLREPPTQTYVMYSEPYLFSDILFGGNAESADYENASLLPSFDNPFDQFSEGMLKTYEPLHERKAITNLPAGKGFGDWEGIYLKPAECSPLTGHLTNDLLNEFVTPINSPLWDASIYKLPPSCEVNRDSYKADVNHFKIGYAYFAADLSCAEDGFFDLRQEASWRYPVTRDSTLYVVPGVKHYSIVA